MYPIFNSGCGYPVTHLFAGPSPIYGRPIDGIFPQGTRFELNCKSPFTPLGSPSYCQPDGSWKPDSTCIGNNITSFHTLRIGFVSIAVQQLCSLNGEFFGLKSHGRSRGEDMNSRETWCGASCHPYFAIKNNIQQLCIKPIGILVAF